MKRKIYNPFTGNLLQQILLVPMLLLNTMGGILIFFLLLFSFNIKEIRVEHGIDICASGWFGRWFDRMGWGAFTFGITMFYWSKLSYNDLLTRTHERIHIRQEIKWGPLWPIIYIAYLTEFGYENNPFEIEAREKSEKLFRL